MVGNQKHASLWLHLFFFTAASKKTIILLGGKGEGYFVYLLLKNTINLVACSKKIPKNRRKTLNHD